MNRVIPCVLMRAGTSRGPFFLRDWLPDDVDERNEALIGAIGASDLLQLDGLGGGSTLTSKVAIVSRSSERDCDVDYLFAQVGVGQRSVDTRPNCGNMLSGVGPFAIEQGLVPTTDGETVVRVFNVNTGARINVTVQTPGGRVQYDGGGRIDGVAGTAAPIRLDFLDAWGSMTGSVFPTKNRIDVIDGVEATCIDAAMALMIVRARDLGKTGAESPIELDADEDLLRRIEVMRRQAGLSMGLGDVSQSVVPKPVLISEGEDGESITSRYFTPRRCHSSHAVTGAIGVATAFCLPGTVASSSLRPSGSRTIGVLHPQGRIEVAVGIVGHGQDVEVTSAALVRTARKIFDGNLHLPPYVFSKGIEAEATTQPSAPHAVAHGLPPGPITPVVPTAAGGGNDRIARLVAAKLGPLLDRAIRIDNRSGSDGTIASEYVARSTPDGSTLMLGYIGTHAMRPALQRLRYDPIADFEPVGLVACSSTVLVCNPRLPVVDVDDLIAQLVARPEKFSYASAGIGTAPQFAAELFKLGSGTAMPGLAYDGAAAALHHTVLGDVDVMFPSLLASAPLLKTGKLRPLAIAGPARVALFDDVPTLAEVDVPGIDVTQWYALFAPAGTPPTIVDRIANALQEALADDITRRRVIDLGGEVRSSTPQQLRALVRTECAKWRRVASEASLSTTSMVEASEKEEMT